MVLTGSASVDEIEAGLGANFVSKMMNYLLKMMEFVLKMMNYLLKMMKFVLKMMNHLLKMMEFVLKMMNSAVAGVATGGTGVFLKIHK